MKKLFLALLFALPLPAQQPGPEAAAEPTKPLTMEQLKLENAQLKVQLAQLKEQLLQMQFQLVQVEKQRAQKDLDEVSKKSGENVAKKQ